MSLYLPLMYICHLLWSLPSITLSESKTKSNQILQWCLYQIPRGRQNCKPSSTGSSWTMRSGCQDYWLVWIRTHGRDSTSSEIIYQKSGRTTHWSWNCLPRLCLGQWHCLQSLAFGRWWIGTSTPSWFQKVFVCLLRSVWNVCICWSTMYYRLHGLADASDNAKPVLSFQVYHDRGLYSPLGDVHFLHSSGGGKCGPQWLDADTTLCGNGRKRNSGWTCFSTQGLNVVCIDLRVWSHGLFDVGLSS